MYGHSDARPAPTVICNQANKTAGASPRNQATLSGQIDVAAGVAQASYETLCLARAIRVRMAGSYPEGAATAGKPTDPSSLLENLASLHIGIGSNLDELRDTLRVIDQALG
jgi:hypothetical protein